MSMFTQGPRKDELKNAKIAEMKKIINKKNEMIYSLQSKVKELEERIAHDTIHIDCGIVIEACKYGKDIGDRAGLKELEKSPLDEWEYNKEGWTIIIAPNTNTKVQITATNRKGYALILFIYHLLESIEDYEHTIKENNEQIESLRSRLESSERKRLSTTPVSKELQKFHDNDYYGHHMYHPDFEDEYEDEEDTESDKALKENLTLIQIRHDLKKTLNELKELSNKTNTPIVTASQLNTSSSFKNRPVRFFVKIPAYRKEKIGEFYYEEIDSKIDKEPDFLDKIILPFISENMLVEKVDGHYTEVNGRGLDNELYYEVLIHEPFEIPGEEIGQLQIRIYDKALQRIICNLLTNLYFQKGHLDMYRSVLSGTIYDLCNIFNLDESDIRAHEEDDCEEDD